MEKSEAWKGWMPGIFMRQCAKDDEIVRQKNKSAFIMYIYIKYIIYCKIDS